jgi:hypothetical protein
MLTVLIATHNGTDTLGRTLERFCQLAAPPGGWKLLVVNNASTDRTEELVLGFGDRLPLEYLVEPSLGKPYALNTGLEHISGDLVVFADDDVLPEPDWLAAWRSAVDRNPEYAIFGGAIEPLYERNPPEWLSRTDWTGVLFSQTDPHSEGPIPPIGSIFGPNMAVRTAALADGTRFDERYLAGPMGLLGDETDFVTRLAARGNKTCFVPSAKVRHIVHPSQFAWWWMLKRFHRHGRTLLIVEVQRNGRRAPEMFQAPRHLIRRAVTAAATLPLALLSCDSFRIFSHLRRIAYDLGSIAQARALHRNPEWRDLGVLRAADRLAIPDPPSSG